MCSWPVSVQCYRRPIVHQRAYDRNRPRNAQSCATSQNERKRPFNLDLVVLFHLIFLLFLRNLLHQTSHETNRKVPVGPLQVLRELLVEGVQRTKCAEVGQQACPCGFLTQDDRARRRQLRVMIACMLLVSACCAVADRKTYL